MRSSIIVSAALYGLSLAQLSVINGALDQVGASIADITKAAQGVGSDVSTTTPLISASDKAKSVLQQATTQVSGAQPLSLTDALQLQQSSQKLGGTIDGLVQALGSKKPNLDQLGVTSVALQTVKQQQTLSDALTKAIVSKVPAIGQGIAQNQIDGINQKLAGLVQTLSAPPAGGAAAAPAAAGGHA